jgi:NTE family protein
MIVAPASHPSASRFRFPRRTAAALCALAACCAFAQGTQPPAKPRVALVLGGGGARGGAHLGVLEVLEELRVPVDCITGTSMGALVGGAYAAGVSPAEIRAKVKRTEWNAIFDDSTGRQETTIRNKEIGDRFYSALEIGVGSGGVKYREGAVAGEKVKLFFNELVRADLGDRPIEELRLPLAVIATDIGTGERVAIRTGNLTSAMRASMSVPGILAPAVRDGRKLVDGGLVDNVPIAEARDLCKADVVIAVNVGSPLMKPEDVTGILSVIGQMVNLLTEQNVSRSLAILKPTDVYMRPELGNLTATEFTRLEEAAEIGRKAALGVREQLQRLSVSPQAYAAWSQNVRLAGAHAAPVVDEIVIARSRFVSEESIRGGISQKEGAPLDSAALGNDLMRQLNHGDLHSLDYSVMRERERTILRITPVEKPWGPNYMRFGMNLQSDFGGDATYNLRALYRSTWMNKLGGEWLVIGQVGSQQLLGTQFYQPLDPRQNTFLRPFIDTQVGATSIYEDGNRLATYRVHTTNGGLEAGVNLGAWGQARAGWTERYLTADLDTGIPQFPSFRQQVGGITGTLAIDTLDQAFFPTRGVKLDMSYFDAQRLKDDGTKYSRLEARVRGAYSIGPWAMLGQLDGGTAPRGEIPIWDAFRLGGPRRMGGIAPDQMRGGDYVYGSLEAQYRLNFITPLYGASLIGGVSAETGRMGKIFADTTLSGWQQSYGVYVAALTPIGPVYLGVADARNGKTRLYLFIGTP